MSGRANINTCATANAGVRFFIIRRANGFFVSRGQKVPMALTPTTFFAHTHTGSGTKYICLYPYRPTNRACGSTQSSLASFCRTSDSGQRAKSSSITRRRTFKTRSLLVIHNQAFFRGIKTGSDYSGAISFFNFHHAKPAGAGNAKRPHARRAWESQCPPGGLLPEALCLPAPIYFFRQ